MKKLFVYLQITLLMTNTFSGLISPQIALAQEATSSAEQTTPATTEPINIDLSGLSEATSPESSAIVRTPTEVRELNKHDYRANEEVVVTVASAAASEVTATLFDVDGNAVSAKLVKSEKGADTEVKVQPYAELKPGRYRLKIEAPNGVVSTQDFTWGVLAINTNKSIYKPGDEAFIAMAVLDETGEMVCDASVELSVKNPSGEESKMTSDAGTIIVNPECYSKELTVVPDYQATYQTSGTGNYLLQLSATTPDGTYTITDKFEVRESVKFDVDRLTATRIYPPLTYPVTVKVKANEDFAGTIEESVPASFEITPLAGTQEFHQIEMQATTDNQVVIDQALFGIGKPFEGEYPMNQGFGSQHRDPRLSQKYAQFGVTGHDGVDFALPEGTAVIAVDGGKIVRAGEGDYGVTVVIEHSWGKSYYGHLSKVLRSEGDEVKKGQLIASSGSTGLASGPHLHFGVKPNQNDFENGYFGKVNPIAFFGLEDEKTKDGVVAGVSTEREQVTPGTKVIRWNVSMKAGEEMTLGYQFNAPDVSPELYRIGPLKFVKDGTNVFEEVRQWQIAADAIVVTGGITSAETQFGGLQRKVAYVNSKWYAFWNDGTDIFWTYSSDGINWDNGTTNLDLFEDNDNDNYNPSIDFSGNYIHVAYLDESGDQVEILTIDTTSDLTSQTTNPCRLTSPGAFTVSTYLVSIASLTTDVALVAYSDTSAGSNVDVFEVSGLSGASCSFTDVQPGEIAFGTQGSGITAADRPVLVGPTSGSNVAVMVYQDGSNLRSATYDATYNEWRRNHTLIANVTDTTYSVVTDSSNDVWVLSQNGTTATRLYHYPQASTGMDGGTQIEADAGDTADDGDSYMDIECPTATNCKIVFIDNMESAGSPDLVFRDCDDATCSSGTSFIIDSDVGDGEEGGNPRMHCPASDNCKIVYGDMTGTAPDAVFVDCPAGHEDCDNAGTSGTCGTGGRTCTIVDTDLGAADSEFYGDVYCPSTVSSDTDCKFAFFNTADETNDAIWFADCNSAACGTRDALTSIVADMNADLTNADTRLSLWCPSATNCKLVFHDATNGDLLLRDCSNADCSTADATTTIDSDVGGGTVGVPNAIDCSAGSTDCKLVYADGSQNEVNFVDCANEACSSPTITKIDDTAGGVASGAGVGSDVSIYCVSGTDCKGSFASTTGGTYFFDCDDAACTSGNVEDIGGATNYDFMSNVNCAAGSTDCKIVAISDAAGGAPVVRFFDCTNDNCDPDWESLTAPWTSETSVASLSLTYDSSNSDLIANIAKDVTNQQAYYNVSDATTISWTGSTAYEFTAGAMDNMSSPEGAAGTSLMGVLVRLGSNLEFDLYSCGSCGPTMDQVMRHGAWFSGGTQQAFTF